MKYKKVLGIFGFIVIVAATIAPSTASAEIADLTIQTGCSTQPSYTGLLDLQAEKFDVYARLAKRGEQAQVQAYAQVFGDQQGKCTSLGKAISSGDKWTKLGSFSATNARYVIELAGDTMEGIPSANRPTVMLVPHAASVCVPAVECEVTVEGLRGYVRPTGALLSNSALHVLRVTDPAGDVVKSVHYYTDNNLVYSSKELAPFDLRYQEYPEQKLSRVVEYESGQKVVIDSSVSLDHRDTFLNFIFRVTQRYPKTTAGIIWSLIFMVIFVISIALTNINKNRHLWLRNHGYEQEQAPSKLQQILENRFVVWAFGGIKLLALGSVALLCIIAINTYGFSVTTVEGQSMQKTYFTGDTVVVNKFAKTLAGLNGREYTPNRGDVVIVRSVFGDATAISRTDAPLLIKRVLGLPGERVVVRNGVLTVYSSESPQGIQPDKGSTWEKNMTQGMPSENLDITLSASEIFVSGDNRPQSIDSRFNGPLQLKEVVGSVGFRIWPPSHSTNNP